MSDSTPRATKPGQKALLIGINRYVNLIGNDLAGCVSDVALVRQLLIERYGFLDADVESLTDETPETPTRSSILAALDRLVLRTGAGDRVVLYYAGHGSRVRNPRRPSGYSETIVPRDSGRAQLPNRDILNDELRSYLRRLTDCTPYVTIIFDCCHSATLHRDRFGEGLRSIPADPRPVEQSGDLERLPSGVQSESQWLSSVDRYVAFLACRDHERAHEICLASSQGGDPALTHGALTYHLVQELRSCSAEQSNREIFEVAARRVAAAFPDQHPVCEGALARTAIGTTNTEPLRYALVSSVEGSTVQLDVGLSHGAVIGSEWEIFPPGTRDFAAYTLPRAVVRIDSARAATSQALIATDSIPVEPFSRAVETRRPVELRLPVELVSVAGTDPDYASQLSTLLDRSLWLRATTAEPTAVRVYQLPPRSEASPGLPVPQLSTVDTECWAVIGRDGALLMRPIKVNRQRLLIENMEKLARQRFLRSLSNPQSPLCGKIVWRVAAKGAPDAASTLPAATDSVEHASSPRIEIWVRNQHSRTLFLTFLLLDAEGGVQILCPPAGGHLAIAAGWQGSLLPSDEPCLPSMPAQILLVVSTLPIDLTPVVQTKVRGREPPSFEGSDTALGQLLRDALSERVEGSVRVTPQAQSFEWTAELQDLESGGDCATVSNP